MMTEEAGNPKAEGRSDEGSSLTGSDERFVRLAKDAFKAGESSLEADASAARPQSIGQYRIVSTLGEGGMGTVYEAEQQHPRRPVALKVVRGGRYVDEHYVRLFEREAQTLARLKHPGIAAIHESGHTDDGQHFFAMELVRGMPLDQYVRKRRLNRRARLELFCKVCDAINYAHQRGVIHRDLKPSNILIDADGQPKVLDFGLARITDWDITVSTVVTEVGKIQGTLTYMSPEQARGNPDEIDLRSDVYSLGVILFELTTGQLPYEVGQSVLHEAVRTVCEEPPRRPSTFDRSLRGDLETVMLKALGKEPARRYHSAAALGEDIERFLTNQPILARPPSTLYQFRKLAARHKAPFAFVAALFVLITSFGLWMQVLYRRAQNEAETSEQTLEFLIDIFKSSDPDTAQGNTITAREILARGAERVASELKDQPLVQAKLMHTVGIVYRNFGLHDRAVELLKSALRIRRREFGEQHAAVAESLHHLGWALMRKGDYREAEARLKEGLDMGRELLGNEHRDVADNLVTLAALKRRQGAYADAALLIGEALDIQRRVLPEKHEDIAGCLETLAEVLIEQGDYVGAEAVAREGLQMRCGLLGDKHSHVASTRETLAAALRGMGKYAKAETEAGEAVKIYRKVYSNSKDKEHEFVAGVLTLLGGLRRDQHDFNAAGRHLRDALQIYEDRAMRGQLNAAKCMNELAWSLFATGDYSEAESLFNEALKIYETRTDKKHPKVCDPMLGLARTRLARGGLEGTQALLELKGVVALCREVRPGHWSTASAESALGDYLVKLGRYKEAEPFLTESYDDMKTQRGIYDRYVVEALKRVIELYDAWGKPDKAAKYRAMRAKSVSDG